LSERVALAVERAGFGARRLLAFNLLFCRAHRLRVDVTMIGR
jgi:hypothetical protein